MATYRVLTGVSYPPNKRAEAGDVISDLPSRSIKWLAEAGAIEKVDAPDKPEVSVSYSEPVALETPVDEPSLEEDN